MEVRSIIWDWNGTIIDDVQFGVEFMDRFLRSHGRPGIDRQKYRTHFCFPVRNFYRALDFHFDTEEEYRENARRFHEQYEQWVYQCHLHSGAAELLRTLQAHGIRQSIFSGLPHDHLERHVAHFGVRQYFEQIVGTSNTHATGKLEQTEGLLQTFGFEPSTTILIGDTRHDAEVAAKLGVRCILVAAGYNLFEDLARTGCETVSNLTEARTRVLDKL